MDWDNKRVLVTGAGGFIGSHLTEALVDQGARVRVFVRYNSRGDIGLLSLLPADKREQLEIIAGDLRDQHAVAEACRGVSHVFHLGALIAIPYSYVHPREVVETNVIGTLNILMAARDRVERVVHTSTSEVYGTALQVPISEEHPLQGQSPYHPSVQCIWAAPVSSCSDPNDHHTGPHTGPGPPRRPEPLPRLYLRQGHGRWVPPGRCFGESHLRVAASEKAIGQVINIGSNHEVSIGDLAEKIIRLVGRDIELVTDEQRLRPERSEVRRLLADNQRAAEWLNWQPRTSLDEGLSKTIDWVAQHLDRFRPDEYLV